MQLKVKAFKGEFMHASKYLMVSIISLFSICAYAFKLSLFMKISLLSSFKGINKCLYIVSMHVCLNFMLVQDQKECIFQWFTEALYEKKQTIVPYDAQFANLHAQVEQWEAAAKKSQGKVIGQ